MEEMRFELELSVTLTSDSLRVGRGDSVLCEAKLAHINLVAVTNKSCVIGYQLRRRKELFPPFKPEPSDSFDAFINALRKRLPAGATIVDRRGSDVAAPPPAHAPSAPLPIPGAAPPAIGLRARIAQILGWVNLCYLGVLPAVATFAIIHRYGVPVPPLLVFIIGAVVVGLEVSMLAVYSRFPRSVLLSLLVLVDGPLLALLSAPGDPSLFDFAIRGFLIDGSAVVLAICLLGITDRIGPLFVAGFLIPFAGIVALFWPYLAHDLPRTAAAIGTLAVGTVWATIANHRTLALDEEARDPAGGATIAYMIVFILLWVAAMWSATVLHNLHAHRHADGAPAEVTRTTA